MWCPGAVWNKFAISISYDSQPAENLPLNYNSFQRVFPTPRAMSFSAISSARTVKCGTHIRRGFDSPSRPSSRSDQRAFPTRERS